MDAEVTDTLLQMPNLPARRKAVMHAEAMAVRAEQYSTSNAINLEKAVLILCEDGRWKNAGVVNARLQLKWDDDWPLEATGMAFDFRKGEATTVHVKALPDGNFETTMQILTLPEDEIRYHTATDRIFWRELHDEDDRFPTKVLLGKNPFAGWLDVALTVEGLKPQLALPPPGDDAA